MSQYYLNKKDSIILPEKMDVVAFCDNNEQSIQNSREIEKFMNSDENEQIGILKNKEDQEENSNFEEKKFENKLSVDLTKPKITNQSVIEEKEKSLNERENNIKLKENQLSEKEKILNEIEEKNKQKQKGIEINIEDLNEKESKINQKEDELYTKEKSLNEKEQVNKQVEKEIWDLNEKDKLYREKEDQLSTKKKFLNEKEEKLNKPEFIQAFNEKEKKCKEIEDQLSAKENSLDKREEIIREKEKDNVIYSNARIFKENINSLNEDIILKEQKLNKITIVFQEEKNQFEKYKNEILNKYLQTTENEQPILIGLNDVGTTCYMNATLECLSNINELTDYFLNQYTSDPKDETKKISNAYYEVIKNLWDKKNNNIPYSPSTFKEVLSAENTLFEGDKVNDSKDLIDFLIERLHTELNNCSSENVNQYLIDENDQLNEERSLQLFLQNYNLNYNSIISDLFYGIYETKSVCHGCQTMRFNFQIYSILEFPLEDINKYCFNGGKRQLKNEDGSNPDIDIYECFDYHKKIDLISGDNQMYCTKCGTSNNAFYGTSLYSAPKILIINLNRGKGGIYKCNVIFPEELNIFNYVKNKHGPNYFELFAVISLYDNTNSSEGKFVAFCKNRIDNNWYLYDDALIAKCKEPKEYLKGMPYILFYRKK